MAENLQWTYVKDGATLSDLANVHALDHNAIKALDNDVLLLPCNTALHDVPEGQNLFPIQTKELLLVMKENNIRSDFYDDGREKRELTLKHIDVLMPVLLFFSDPAAQLGLNVLANWIYDQWIRIKPERTPSVKIEYAIADANNGISLWRKIEGPADALVPLIRAEAAALRGNTIKAQAKKKKLQATEASVQTSIEEEFQDSARRRFKEAQNLIKKAQQSLDENKKEEAEKDLRSSLRLLREASLLAPSHRQYLKELHKAGKLVHDLFGCMIKPTGGQYMVHCPVMLSHTRGGFSVGGSGKSVCSICGNDSFDCTHIRGRTYDNVTALRLKGVCNICLQEDCEHVEGETYDGVRAIGIKTDVKIDHVAWVEQPAQPLNAVGAFSLAKSEVMEIVPISERSNFHYGQTPLFCHHCCACRGE